MILTAVIALLGMGYVFMGREKNMADRLRSGGGTADTAAGLTVRAAGFALLGVVPGSLYLGGAGRSVQAASLCAGLAVQLCWMLPKLRAQEPASLTVAEICAKDRFARAGLGAVEVLSLLSLTAALVITAGVFLLWLRRMLRGRWRWRRACWPACFRCTRRFRWARRRC